jgi:arylsulfatase A-like enzyme
MKENKKNIIIIIVDALRTKNMSLYGYGKETDKNMKKIARESLVFKNFFSSSNSTDPSLMSLFTGRYPSNHGIIHQFPYTTREEIEDMGKKVTFWFPSFLKNKGYETIGIDWIGRWFKAGFDYYDEKEEKQNILKKFMNIPVVKRFLLNAPNWVYKAGKKIIKTRASLEFPSAKETMNLGISKIKSSKKPFFLFIHFLNTHFPFKNVDYKGSGKRDVHEFLEKIKDESKKKFFKKRITDIGLFSIQDIFEKYDVSIKEVDKQIGRLHDFLKKSGLWEDTIFIILADHGVNIIEHEVYLSSSSLFEESIHVPLIVRLPGIKAKEIKEFSQNIDIVPTLLDYLKEKANKKFDGKSLLNLIKGKKIRDRVFFWDGLSADVRGLRTFNKKLIFAKDQKCNLCKSFHHEEIEEYDLEKDPGETKNIYSGKSELMDFLKKLR